MTPDDDIRERFKPQNPDEFIAAMQMVHHSVAEAFIAVTHTKEYQKHINAVSDNDSDRVRAHIMAVWNGLACAGAGHIIEAEEKGSAIMYPDAVVESWAQGLVWALEAEREALKHVPLGEDDPKKWSKKSVIAMQQAWWNTWKHALTAGRR